MTARVTTCAGNLVVQSYLDRLLAEVPGAAAEIAQTSVPTICADAEVAQTPDPTACADADHTSRDVANHDAPVMPAAYGNEEWRAEPFQALLFRVQTVQFAAPLIRLHGVVPWSEEIADLPDTPDWFRGLLVCRDQKVRVVDTARLVMQGQNIDVEARPGHIILLDSGHWGMTCSDLSEVLTVTPQSVQWRARNVSRPWLAGTLREKLCAMLDIDALTQMLERGSV